LRGAESGHDAAQEVDAQAAVHKSKDKVSQSIRPSIVGAGPVGLGAALFLARNGRAPRIVEMRDKPSQQSTALAINPRTLCILEPTGLTRRMLELGLPIHGVHFYRRSQVLAAVSFADIHPKYPFMLALSQAVTERLLAQEFEAAGGEMRGSFTIIVDERVRQ